MEMEMVSDGMADSFNASFANDMSLFGSEHSSFDLESSDLELDIDVDDEELGKLIVDEHRVVEGSRFGIGENNSIQAPFHLPSKAKNSSVPGSVGSSNETPTDSTASVITLSSHSHLVAINESHTSVHKSVSMKVREQKVQQQMQVLMMGDNEPLDVSFHGDDPMMDLSITSRNSSNPAPPPPLPPMSSMGLRSNSGMNMETNPNTVGSSCTSSMTYEELLAKKAELVAKLDAVTNSTPANLPRQVQSGEPIPFRPASVTSHGESGGSWNGMTTPTPRNSLQGRSDVANANLSVNGGGNGGADGDTQGGKNNESALSNFLRSNRKSMNSLNKTSNQQEVQQDICAKKNATFQLNSPTHGNTPMNMRNNGNCSMNIPNNRYMSTKHGHTQVNISSHGNRPLHISSHGNPLNMSSHGNGQMSHRNPLNKSSHGNGQMNMSSHRNPLNISSHGNGTMNMSSHGNSSLSSLNMSSHGNAGTPYGNPNGEHPTYQSNTNQSSVNGFNSSFTFCDNQEYHTSLGGCGGNTRNRNRCGSENVTVGQYAGIRKQRMNRRNSGSNMMLTSDGIGFGGTLPIDPPTRPSMRRERSDGNLDKSGNKRETNRRNHMDVMREPLLKSLAKKKRSSRRSSMGAASTHSCNSVVDFNDSFGSIGKVHRASRAVRKHSLSHSQHGTRSSVTSTASSGSGGSGHDPLPSGTWHG